MNIRKDFESKLGKPIYSFTLSESKNSDYTLWVKNPIVEADHDNTIVNKILPFINEVGL